jgi:hypothetical protein
MKLNLFTLLHLSEKSLILEHTEQNAFLTNDVLNTTYKLIINLDSETAFAPL